MRADSKKDVIVKLEWDNNVFGEITGQSGVTWENLQDAQQGGGD